VGTIYTEVVGANVWSQIDIFSVYSNTRKYTKAVEDALTHYIHLWVPKSILMHQGPVPHAAQLVPRIFFRESDTPVAPMPSFSMQ
jgi:histidinol-phosphate/aromatic aminotransferase/cobyric acid decarboxylase-like protein